VRPPASRRASEHRTRLPHKGSWGAKDWGAKDWGAKDWGAKERSEPGGEE
jgi:hypothetical protein